MERNEALVEAFAAELRKLRENARPRMSQEGLANIVGINRTYIAKLELAKNQPTLSVLFELSKALSYSELTLFENTVKRYKRALETNNKVK